MRWLHNRYTKGSFRGLSGTITWDELTEVAQRMKQMRLTTRSSPTLKGGENEKEKEREREREKKNDNGVLWKSVIFLICVSSQEHMMIKPYFRILPH